MKRMGHLTPALSPERRGRRERPLLSVAVLLICGIVLGDNVALDWRWPVAIATFLGIVALALATTRAAKLLLAGGIIFTGIALQTIRTAVLSPKDIRSLIGAA